MRRARHATVITGPKTTGIVVGSLAESSNVRNGGTQYVPVVLVRHPDGRLGLARVGDRGKAPRWPLGASLRVRPVSDATAREIGEASAGRWFTLIAAVVAFAGFFVSIFASVLAGIGWGILYALFSLTFLTLGVPLALIWNARSSTPRLAGRLALAETRDGGPAFATDGEVVVRWPRLLHNLGLGILIVLVLTMWGRFWLLFATMFALTDLNRPSGDLSRSWAVQWLDALCSLAPAMAATATVLIAASSLGRALGDRRARRARDELRARAVTVPAVVETRCHVDEGILVLARCTTGAGAGETVACIGPSRIPYGGAMQLAIDPTDPTTAVVAVEDPLRTRDVWGGTIRALVMGLLGTAFVTFWVHTLAMIIGPVP